MKKALLILALLTMVGLAAAKYSDEFPLGTYSYLSEKPWFMNNLNALSNAMHQLGYNSTIMETFNASADLTPLYSALNADSIDVIISDRSWSNSTGNEKYATTGLTTSSYYKFEAEYEHGSNLSNEDITNSQFWYGSRNEDLPGTDNDINRVGFPFYAGDVTPPASNDYVWRCEPNPDPSIIEHGWAYTDLRWRWLTTAGANIRIGKEFILNKYSSDPAQDSLYIKFHLRFYIPSSDELPGNTILLSFAPVGFQYTYNADGSVSGHMGIPEPIVHTNGSQTGNVTALTLDEYYDRFGGRLPTYPFRDIEIRISYQELINKGLLLPDGSSRYKLVNFNPRLHYAGHYTLDLDYIEIEDKMHRVLMDNYDEYDTGVDARVADLSPITYQDMIKGVYTMDEPFQPQFNSFKIIQDMFSTLDVRPMTATYDYQYNQFRMAPGQDIFYDHQYLFRESVSPRIIMPDLYPIKPNTVDHTYLDWNDPTCLNEQNDNVFIQSVLSKKVTDKYRDIKNYFKQNPSLNGLMYPVVQAFGAWENSSSHTGWISWALPPSETQKVLQYLPLCYGSDGVFNYRLFGYVGHPQIAHDEYAALTSIGNGTPTIAAHPITYNALLEANEKIIKYGPQITQMNWIDAVTITESSIEPADVDLSLVLISSIEDIDANQTGPYGCFVECGLFTDTSNHPYLMLVNRRANYFNQSGSFTQASLVPVASFDTCFPAFDSQVIAVYPDSTAHVRYGTHIGFIDPLDDTLYHALNQSIPIEIQPGDGKLLQMISTLPETVDTAVRMASKGILAGEIELEEGGFVNVEAGTELAIKANSQITIHSGASFTFRGIVSIEDNVTISVLDDGTVNFDNATCTWGQGSMLEVIGGTLSISGGSMDKSDNISRWPGIRVSDSSQVLMDNATISNAQFNACENSNCMITNSRFYVPRNSFGLKIENATSGYTTEISNTMPGKGFYGTSDQGSTGIYLSAIQNQVNISNVNFHDLETGISKDATPYAIDTVNECRFVNCKTGITLFFNGSSTVIEWSKFTNDQPGQNGTGINLIASSPSISNCYFNNLYCGVQTESSLQSVWGTNHTYISESNFNDCNRGIESRNSNHYLKENYFYNNNDGIVNHASSNLNLSYNKNNVMKNIESNILFYDTLPYQSTIQLLAGHNDFYHMRSAGGSYAVDFCFDVNYYDSQGGFGVLRKINASDNWFEGAQVTVNDPLYADYVYVDSYDLLPSMPPPGPNTGRLFMALDYESQELYELAAATFKAMIDEDEEDEKSDVTSAIDGLYRCTFMIPDPSWELSDYFDAKALQFAIDEPSLSAILKDYLAKVFVLNKDFQAAVDLIQLRISDPINEIDSLRAVLDLEIVLQIAAMEESKRPLTTKYVQYQYPDVQIFEKKHSDNWDKYSRLLLQNNADTSPLIAPMPLIQSNFPNPFNPSTTITFSIPEAGRVRVSVYNLKGQKVKDLINTDMLRGNHKLVWDGKDGNNRNASSGIYFLRLESGGKTSIRKTMLMK